MSKKAVPVKSSKDGKRAHVRMIDTTPNTPEINRKDSISKSYRSGPYVVTNVKPLNSTPSFSIDSLNNLVAKRNQSKRKDSLEAEKLFKKMLPFQRTAVLNDKQGNKLASFGAKRLLRVAKDVIPEDAYESNEIVSWNRIEGSEIKGKLSWGEAQIQTDTSQIDEKEPEEYAVISAAKAKEFFGTLTTELALKAADHQIGDNITELTLEDSELMKQLYTEEKEERLALKQSVAEHGQAEFDDAPKEANVLLANGKPVMVKALMQRKSVNWEKVPELEDIELLHYHVWETKTPAIR